MKNTSNNNKPRLRPRLLKSREDYVPVNDEPATGPSMTQPYEAYTIQELFRRHAAGTLPEVERQGVYPEKDNEDFDSEDLEKLGRADLFDKEQFSEKLTEQIKAQKTHLDNQIKTAKDKQAKKQKLFEDFEREQEAKTQATPLSPNTDATQSKPASDK